MRQQWDVYKSSGFPTGNCIAAGQVNRPAWFCSFFTCQLSACEALLFLSGAAALLSFWQRILPVTPSSSPALGIPLEPQTIPCYQCNGNPGGVRGQRGDRKIQGSQKMRRDRRSNTGSQQLASCAMPARPPQAWYYRPAPRSFWRVQGSCTCYHVSRARPFSLWILPTRHVAIDDDCSRESLSWAVVINGNLRRGRAWLDDGHRIFSV